MSSTSLISVINSLTAYENRDEINLQEGITDELQSSDSNLLIDKVYTFTVEYPILYLNKCIWFDDEYNYHLSIGIVTPHACSMVFTYWDTNNTRFDYKFRTMTQAYYIDEYSKYRFITECNGTYILQFKALTTESLNIHIILKKGLLWIDDKDGDGKKDDPDGLDDRIPKWYNTRKFKDGDSHVLPLLFRTDFSYRVYFIRGTGNTSGYVLLDHHITDPDGIRFKIYHAKPLKEAPVYYRFNFGTATSGLYAFNITIHCEAETVIIGWAIYEDYNISNIIDPGGISLPDYNPDLIDDNSTTDTTNNTQSGIRYYISKEWTIGIILFTGILVGVPIIIVVIRKRKNATGI